MSAPPPPLLQLRPSCLLPLWALQLLLLLPLLFLPAPRRRRCLLRSSSYSSRRRRRRRCLAAPKPVTTQVKKACFGRVLLRARYPQAC